jgi:hypothetical protein
MSLQGSQDATSAHNSDHIRSSRTAFMTYHPSFTPYHKIPSNGEYNGRNVSSIIGHCWNSLSEDAKQLWKDKAAANKAEHDRKRSAYRFRPISRANQLAKKQMKKNWLKHVDQCKAMATSLTKGRKGRELDNAVDDS